MEDVPLERNLDGHPLAGLSWERQFEKVPQKTVGKKVPNKTVGEETNIEPIWKVLTKGICTVILWEDYYRKGNLRKVS